MLVLANNLRKKGIVVTEYEGAGRQYREKWLESFVKKEVSPYWRGFLWELIDYQRSGLLEGKDANQAFNRVNKHYCYIFFQESDDVLEVQFASEMRARDLIDTVGEYSDVYVTDKGFNWTYVLAHEPDYGPYFFRRPK